MKLTAMLRALSCLLLLTGSLVPLTAESAAPAATANTPAAVAPADLVVRNRYVMTFRGVFLGTSPEERAERARRNILEVIAGDFVGKVAFTTMEQGKKITIDRKYMFAVTTS